MLRIRRTAAVLLLNGGCFCLLVAGMAAVSDDMRRHLVNLLSADRASELAIVTVPFERIARVALTTFGDYQSHGVLVAFGAVALVLFGLMLST